MLCGCRYVLRSVAGYLMGLLMRHVLCVPEYFDVLQRGEVCCRDSHEVSHEVLMMQRHARLSAATAECTAAFRVAVCCRVS